MSGGGEHIIDVLIAASLAFSEDGPMESWQEKIKPQEVLFWIR